MLNSFYFVDKVHEEMCFCCNNGSLVGNGQGFPWVWCGWLWEINWELGFQISYFEQQDDRVEEDLWINEEAHPQAVEGDQLYVL